jgi:dTDP-4-dehydrorhamnose 3,5-epimerase
MVHIDRNSVSPSSSHSNGIFSIDGCMLVTNFIHRDKRGIFRKVLPLADNSMNIDFSVYQVNLSSNSKAGTIRGFHYQSEPLIESKLISCTRGSVFDVLLDMRPDSVTFGKHVSFQLTPTSGSLLIPPLVAHAFQTLENETEILYLHSNHYNATHSKGINPLDTSLGVDWPLPASVISDSDRQLPNFSEVSL